MYTIKPTSQFKKDLKLSERRGYNIELLTEIIKKLAAGESLAEKNKDLVLIGNFKRCRECHITPDWLLVYEIEKTDLFLYLTRTGTHSDIFGK